LDPHRTRLLRRRGQRRSRRWRRQLPRRRQRPQRRQGRRRRRRSLRQRWRRSRSSHPRTSLWTARWTVPRWSTPSREVRLQPTTPPSHPSLPAAATRAVPPLSPLSPQREHQRGGAGWSPCERTVRVVLWQLTERNRVLRSPRRGAGGGGGEGGGGGGERGGRVPWSCGGDGGGAAWRGDGRRAAGGCVHARRDTETLARGRHSVDHHHTLWLCIVGHHTHTHHGRGTPPPVRPLTHRQNHLTQTGQQGDDGQSGLREVCRREATVAN
jgi:hypothetical protein